MKKILILITLLLGFSVEAATTTPREVKTLFSQTFTLTGKCTAADMVYSWSINGAAGGKGVVPSAGAYGASFLYPWLPADIMIRAVELILIPPAPGHISSPHMPQFTFLMVGNNANGDAMLFVPAGERYGRHDFPSDTGFPFPSSLKKTSLTYIDLHGACTAGLAATLMLTLYYTMN